MTRRRAVVTGVGVVSPLGIGTEAFWQACVAGKSGIDHVRSFDPSELPSQIAGEVVDFDPLTHMSEKMAGRTERFMQLALAASQEARANAGVDDTVEAVRVGVMLGNGSGGLPSFDRYLLRGQQQGWGAVDPLALLKVLPDVAASHLAVTMKAKGPVMTLVAACVSSTQAIGQATRLIRHGEADVVFASGTEASITPVGMSGFCLLRALSTRNDAPDKASRPFDTERDGFVIAEGAATLVVEELEHAQSRDAPILAEILGYAQTCDANHIVMPEPRGEGAARCIDLALRDAQVTRDEVDYINAHGTSTPLNDVAETRAIKSIFGERSYDIPISSIKSMVGHALGAAGAIETVAAVLTLQSGVLPPTINLHSPDPECDLDYVANQSRVHRCRTVLKNSFGFGGQNACLVLRGFVKKLVAPSTATYYAAGGIYEKQGSNVTKNYFLDGQRVSIRKSGVLNYLLTDHLGSVTHVVNSTNGALVGSQTYFPFGQVRTTVGGGVGGTTDKQFTGHQAEGSLYFMKARFQDPQAGRFLQPDLVGVDVMNPQTLNRYSYVGNNPLNYTDPTGQCHHLGCWFHWTPDSHTADAATPLERPTPPPLAYPLSTPTAPNPDCVIRTRVEGILRGIPGNENGIDKPIEFIAEAWRSGSRVTVTGDFGDHVGWIIESFSINDTRISLSGPQTFRYEIDLSQQPLITMTGYAEQQIMRMGTHANIEATFDFGNPTLPRATNQTAVGGLFSSLVPAFGPFPGIGGVGANNHADCEGSG